MILTYLTLRSEQSKPLWLSLQHYPVATLQHSKYSFIIKNKILYIRDVFLIKHLCFQDIVEKDALAEIKRNFSFFSVSQQQELAVHPNDFVRSFVYEIGIMFEDNDQGKYIRAGKI